MEKKPRTSWSQFIRAVGWIISGLYFIFGLLSNFTPLPQIMNWEISVLLGFIIFIGFTLWHYIAMQNRIKVLEREIEDLKSGNNPLDLLR